MQQYARSNESFHDVRVVLASEAFGWGYSKLYWDKLVRMMNFRRGIVKGGNVIYRDRASIMRAQGAGSAEIEEAIGYYGTEMDDDEIARFMAKSGNEVSIPEELKQYEGPIVKFVFNGDLYLEPNCMALDLSSYAIEQYTVNDLQLEKWSQMTYEDPDTGEETAVFDPEALQELIDTGGDSDLRDNEPNEDLRNMFNASIGREREQEYYLPLNLRPRKKFNILEQHSQDAEDGKMYITWCSEKWRDRTLGRKPYDPDLYGKYQYTDLTPLPDLISVYGDSTPRLLRHLYNMHNLTVAQNFDYVTNLLKPFILRRMGVNVEPEVVVRGLFRELQVADLNGIKPLLEPPLPTGAFEREAQIMRMMSLAEPSLTSTEGGTAANPQAGKTATTALLASKAADALTQFKFDGRNRYLRELGQKKLWMNQQMQAQNEHWEIEKRYWGEGLRKRVEQIEGPMPEWALKGDGGNHVFAVRLDPMDIQNDFEVEPEAGSYLAVDDEMRQQAAQNLTQVAMANPDVVDRQKVIRFQLSTIRGIGNPDDYLLPPTPPEPPPPKINANIQVPLDKMPGDIINQLLPMLGLQPSEALAHKDQMDAISSMADAGQSAGEAADSLLSPGEAEQDQQERMSEHMLQAGQHAHDADMQTDQQHHEALMTGLEHGRAQQEQQTAHGHALIEAAQAHGHATAQAEQSHRHALTQGALTQAAQGAQKSQQIASQERLHKAGLRSQEKVAAQKNKPNGKPNGKANGHAPAQSSASAPQPQVVHIKIEHGPAKRRRTVKLLKGEDGITTGAQIDEE
jgi:hypothetical protein